MIIWGKEGKNGRKLILKMGCNFENFKIFVQIKFASKVIMFEKTLRFNQAIIIYYARQKTIILQHNIVPNAQVWAITKAITSCLNLMVLACVMNQFHSHCYCPIL
jgi:hypothetical protein